MISIIIANIPFVGYPRSWEAIGAVNSAVNADTTESY